MPSDVVVILPNFFSCMNIKAIGRGKADEIAVVTVDEGRADVRVAPLIDFEMLPFYSLLGDIVTV